MMLSRIEQLCLEKGVRLTDQRRLVAKVLADAKDHPDVAEVYERAKKLDPKVSIATVYRSVKLLEEYKILEKHDFKDGRARYELMPKVHHDHLIDLQTGQVIEFVNEEIETLQKKMAEKLGYKLVDHRLELYGIPLPKTER